MMNNQPLVSVLMTAYNREKYIAEAIESVMASTYQNWELIIVDDQSKDNSYKIAKQYEAKDERIKVYINEKNLGDYPNRNKAASYAKGKYLFYLDSDDLIYSHGIQVLVSSIEKYPQAGFGLVKLHTEAQYLPVCITAKEAYTEHFLQKYIFTNAAGSGIIKREYFEKIGGFSGKRHIGDTELWLKLGAKYPLVKIPGFLGWTRSHPDQEQKYRKEKIENTWINYFLFLNALESENCPLDKQQTQLAKNKLKNSYIRTNILNQGIKKLKIKRAYKIYKNSKLNFGDVIKALKRI